MAGVFISYRRDDTAGYAGGLYRDLVSRFGQDQVFIDINALRPGADYVKSLDEAIESCDAILVLIGPRWTSITDAGGNRRLDSPGDVVRQEVAAALNRDSILVVPVLVGNAPVPPDSELPEPLKNLRRRHAFELSDRRWDYDVEQLVKHLSPAVTPLSPTATSHDQLTGAALPNQDNFRAWLEPERIGGSGPEQVELIIENLGTKTTTFEIDARRKDAGLDIEVSRASVDVEARAKRAVNVVLSPWSGDDLERASLGSDPQALGFVLLVHPSNSPTVAREVSGQFLLLPATVSLRLGRREIEAAGAAAYDVRVENPGRRPVDVALEAEDHSGQCIFAFDRAQLTVEPRTAAHAMLTVTPPERHASVARWPFDVRARPIAPAGPPVQDEGVLIFAPPRIAVRLRNPDIEAFGPGVFAIEVENRGASDVTVVMSATDAAHACTFAFDRPRATIAPGAVAEFELTVTPPGQHPPDARWPFGVLATPDGPRAEPARANGVLIYHPPTVDLSISPAQQSARRSGSYEVSIRNPFPVSLTIRLAASDRSGRLNLRWQERSGDVTVDVPSGQTKNMPLEVAPGFRHQGTEPLTLGFSVAATPIRPPGTTLATQAQFVALPARRRRGGLILFAAGVVLALLVLLQTGWPELFVVAAPLIGGIILRTRWWVLLYPVGLTIWLNVSDALVTEVDATENTRLSETLRDMNREVPDGTIKEVLTYDSTEMATNRRDPCISENLEGCDLTEWSIVALAVLCALIGTVIGKLLRTFNDRR